MTKPLFCFSNPGNRPAWPLGDDWWLVGAERAWRLDDQAPDAEKHYFMVMKPQKPHWQVGLFTADKGDSIAMWLTRLGYATPPDFKEFLARACAHGLPVGMLQFAVSEKGAGRMKAYHATDERGDNLSSLPEAWQALNSIRTGLKPPIAWHTPIEGLASRGTGWEIYTQAINTPYHRIPDNTFHNIFTMLGATCRQYSLSHDGTQTWYYTNMNKTVNGKTLLTLLDLAIPTHTKMMDKVHTALQNGAVIGDMIVQSPEKNVYHPVADLLWPVNKQIVFTP